MAKHQGWKYGRYYRRPRTHQEMVANDETRDEYYGGERTKWGRAQRSKWWLDPWNLEPRHTIQKSWKKKRKKQYRVAGKRGRTIEIICEDYRERWNLQEYCEKYDIPYDVRLKQEYETTIEYIYTKTYVVGWKAVWITTHDNGFHMPMPIHKTVIYNPPLKTKHKKCIGTYWIFKYWVPTAQEK